MCAYERALKGCGEGARPPIHPMRKNDIGTRRGNPGESPYSDEDTTINTITSYRDLDLKSLEELDAAGVHA